MLELHLLHTYFYESQITHGEIIYILINALRQLASMQILIGLHSCTHLNSNKMCLEQKQLWYIVRLPGCYVYHMYKKGSFLFLGNKIVTEALITIY